MSGNDNKSQAAAERIKAQALSAAKGLISRAQAERAAAAATCNVNAYGQKEEGPSRWQERKEAKRQMYLMSTEKAVILGEKPKALPATSGGLQCQKCFQSGHWTYECKNERVYMSRPSRTQQLRNPHLKKTTVPDSCQFVNPDLEKERKEERRLREKMANKEKPERRKRKSKRKHRARSDSHRDSSKASASDSDSEHSSESGSSSYSASSESENKKRQHRKKQRRHRRDSTSSESSESESDDKSSRRKNGRSPSITSV